MLNRTRGVKDKFFQDVDKILYWTTIVVQSIFFGYYGYSIYTSLNYSLFLIIYTLLLVLSTISFIHFLSSYRNKFDKNVKIFKKTFRMFKYVINGSMITFNIIGILSFGGSDIAYTLIVLSTISLIFQIIVEFLRGFISMYIELLTTAFERDTVSITSGVNKLKNVTNVKGNFWGAIDAPFEKAVTDRNSNIIELTEKEKLVDELGEKYKEKLALMKKDKKEKKRKRYNSKTVKEKGEFKKHSKEYINNILKRKKTK